ncbi:hypothetical protein OF829_12500 [Sphingomonas sp. LB-2]|uniref:hypothetical protein n=1 Tax=Sphingomonas caeni TaxID=2984949 RepID=UPI002230942F|nr:hypothetical protein [Sphingomonas caeni]MCW3848062.1 hypothetical protein [Sphingomonas caeni]
MRGLVLAFEGFADLPPAWRDCRTIDAFGKVTFPLDVVRAFVGDAPVAITIHHQLLDILDFEPPGAPYDLCFIRHPDPWGEPRSWLCAIAAIGECLRGELTCVFHRQHEGLAFNFLLAAMLGAENAKFLSAEKVEDAGGERHIALRWQINAKGVQRDMGIRFRNRLRAILRQFYTQIGQFHRNLDYFR